MFGVLTGTRSHPAVELHFAIGDTHRDSGSLLREWVKALPGRRWSDGYKTWTVTDFGTEARDGVTVQRLLDAAGITVIGPDGEPTDLRGLVFTDVIVTSTPVAADSDQPERAATDRLDYDGTLVGLRGVPVADLRAVDRVTAVAMGVFGIADVYDLLHTVPRRYIDLSNPQSVLDVEPGEKVATIGTVTSVKPSADPHGMSRINVRDTRDEIVSCRFFNAGWMMRKFAAGQQVILHGKVETWQRPDQSTAYGMTNPLIDVVAPDAVEDGSGGHGMLPIYPQSAKADVDTWKLHRAAKEAAERINPIEDPIPALAKRHGLVTRARALRAVHLPINPADAEAGRNRLAFDELLRMQLGLLLARHADGLSGAIEHRPTGYLTDQLLAHLPYSLTGAQRRATAEIVADLEAAKPMHRLLQGEVGSGKTNVAMLALLSAVEAGSQGALMAPTEILASQHYAELAEYAQGLTKADGAPVTVVLLTNKVTGKLRKEVVAQIADGRADIVVGTHALLAPAVTFARLGLAVVDEQHRFGVEQRAALRDKGAVVEGNHRFPDMLVATATPIPRTAVLTTFGDLDVSVLDELPPGRTPIQTSTVAGDDAEPGDRDATPWTLIRREVKAGHQAFVVCPMINDSETKSAAAAETTAAMLRAGALAGLSIGVVHGKQKADERTAVMAAFTEGALDVLVATTVIEVGVNVPNATAVVVLAADRFGLAQLHQLRGRVGRDKHAGHCILVADPKTTEGEERIQAMCETSDGFALSEADLRIRGWGTLLGGSQSGTARDLRVADLFRDAALLDLARADARRIVEDDPGMTELPEMLAEVRALIGEEETAWLTSA